MATTSAAITLASQTTRAGPRTVWDTARDGRPSIETTDDVGQHFNGYGISTAATLRLPAPDRTAGKCHSDCRVTYVMG